MNKINTFIAKLFNWIGENTAKRRLRKKKDAESLKAYLLFLIDHNMSLRLEDHALREIISKIDEWPMREDLFAVVEKYLFTACHSENDRLWHAWIRNCRFRTYAKYCLRYIFILINTV